MCDTVQTAPDLVVRISVNFQLIAFGSNLFIVVFSLTGASLCYLAHLKTHHKEYPMKMINDGKKNILVNRTVVISCLSAALGLAGCQQQGPAEKAGKKIDRAAESAQQKIENATETAETKIEGAKESVIDKAVTAGAYIDDSVITTKVKTAILNDPLLNASHIEVTTVKAVVKLSGTVDSEPSISRAIEVAKSQENVLSVESSLVVNIMPSKN